VSSSFDSPRRRQVRALRRLFARLSLSGLLGFAGCAWHRDAALPDTPAALADRLERARIIFIAEKHDEASHHRLQEQIIRALHRRKQPLTVGMEMIDVTQQAALDDYLGKKIRWREFASRTAFDRGWGRTSPAYEHIISWCRRNGVPIIGLNAPDTITRKLSRNQPLTAEEKQIVPNYPEPRGAFEQFRAAMAGHQKRGGLHHYFEAQRAWDQTMAGRILAWLPDHCGTLVVLLGRFHADARTAVPWYVARSSSARQIILDPESKQ
jgi:uncharacterized iron-regulated protein